jgi:glycosyltransferase involved in cell wall biosynthesis
VEKQERLMVRVCMILEGTYPYSIGGVSSWVQEIISGMPEIEFSVVHLYFEKEPSRIKFALPKNLKEVIKLPVLINERHADFDEILSQIPRADIYHSLSTGLAGLIGAEIKRRFGKPFMLTEHGIYWHEIEIGADEIEFGFKLMKMNRKSLILGRTWLSWLQFFKNIARKTYASADSLITVCEWNRRMEISVSRHGRKSQVINNGVKLPPVNVIKKYLNQSSPTIGLVGRVTPIKDIETYIRACDQVRRYFPDARFYVIGPIESDGEY